jgi:hypothetical protein
MSFPQIAQRISQAGHQEREAVIQQLKSFKAKSFTGNGKVRHALLVA